MGTATSFKSVTNNATTLTTGSVNNSSDPVVVNVTGGTGALFPSSNFWISIDNEILLCTSRSTDALTCTRAQQSTTIATHASSATVQLRGTAAQFTEIATAINAVELGTKTLDHVVADGSVPQFEASRVDTTGDKAEYRVTSWNASAFVSFYRKSSTDTRKKWSAGTEELTGQNPDYVIYNWTGAGGAEAATEMWRIVGTTGIRVPNNKPLYGRNAGDSADIEIVRMGTGNTIVFDTSGVGARFAGSLTSGAAAPTNNSAGDITATQGFMANLYGSKTNAASGTLTLSGTSNATKGLVYIRSSSYFSLDETTGQLALPQTGATAGLLIGADVQIYRGAADVLYNADSERITGHLRVGSTTVPSNTTPGDVTAVQLFAASVFGSITNASGGTLTLSGSSHATRGPVISNSNESTPASSGSSTAGIIHRFSQTSGVGVTDLGFDGGASVAWLQARSSADYTTTLGLSLNPIGGNIAVGEVSVVSLGHANSPKTLQLFRSGSNAYGNLDLVGDSTTSGEMLGALVFGSTGAATTKRGVGLYGILSASGVTNATMALHIFTNNAGTYARKLLLAADGTLTLDSYTTAGVLVNSSAGVVTTNALTRTTVTHSGTDYGADAGTWTVDSGDLTSFNYLIDGKRMHVSFEIVTSSTSATPTQLLIVIPASQVSAKRSTGHVTGSDNGTQFSSWCAVLPAAINTKIYIFKDALATGTFATQTNTLTVRGSISFEIV